MSAEEILAYRSFDAFVRTEEYGYIHQLTLKGIHIINGHCWVQDAMASFFCGNHMIRRIWQQPGFECDFDIVDAAGKSLHLKLFYDDQGRYGHFSVPPKWHCL